MDETKDRAKRGRSRVLYEITALLVVMLVASGLVTFFVVRRSQQHLNNESKEKVIQAEINNISSFFNYLTSYLATEVLERSLAIPWEEHTQHFAEGTLSSVQIYLTGMFKEMAASETLGIDKYILIIDEWKGINVEFVYSSSDESLIYEWEVPEYLLEAVSEEFDYLYLEEGVPELDLEGEYLLVMERFEDPALDYKAFVLGVKPMAESIASIEDFYGKESRATSLILGLVVGISLFVVIIIVYLILSYLIRKRITEPIDELATSAEEVMIGNLDVEIKVREGSEFEGLAKAFKEMVDGIRKLIDKSVGG